MIHLRGGVHSCETGLVNGFWIDCADCNDYYHLEPVRDRLHIRDKSYSVILVPDEYKGLKNFKLMHEVAEWDGSGYDKFLCELMYLYSIDDLLKLCCEFGHADWKISKFSANCKRIFDIYKICYPERFMTKRSSIDSADFLNHISMAIEMITLEINGCKGKEYLLRSDFENLFYAKDVFNVTKLFS